MVYRQEQSENVLSGGKELKAHQGVADLKLKLEAIYDDTFMKED